MIPDRKIDFDYPRYPWERYDYSFDFSLMYKTERDENSKIISYKRNDELHLIPEDPNVYEYFIFNNYRIHWIMWDDEVDWLWYDTCRYKDYDNSIQYVWELANDRPHGRWSVLYKNWDRYDGEWKFWKKEWRWRLTKYDWTIIEWIRVDNEYYWDDSEYEEKEEIQQKKEDSTWYKRHLWVVEDIEKNDEPWSDFSWLFDSKKRTEEEIKQSYEDLIEMYTYYWIDYNKAKITADEFLNKWKHH